MFRINNKNSLTTSDVFNVNLEHISHLSLVFLLRTLCNKILVGLYVCRGSWLHFLNKYFPGNLKVISQNIFGRRVKNALRYKKGFSNVIHWE